MAHKIAPAIAVGAPIVIKPAGQTPLGSLLLAELVDETELPKLKNEVRFSYGGGVRFALGEAIILVVLVILAAARL